MPKSDPNASDPPGRPLGLSAAGSVAESFQGTTLQSASESAKPKEVAVPKLESNASDQSGRPLGLSAAGSAARSSSGLIHAICTGIGQA